MRCIVLNLLKVGVRAGSGGKGITVTVSHVGEQLLSSSDSAMLPGLSAQRPKEYVPVFCTVRLYKEVAPAPMASTGVSTIISSGCWSLTAGGVGFATVFSKAFQPVRDAGAAAVAFASFVVVPVKRRVEPT